MAVFYNSATLSYNDNVTNSNIVTGELVEILTVAKSSLSTEYEPNDRITYLITLVNSGTSALTNLTITDDLGSYSFGDTTLVPLSYIVGSAQYYVNGLLQPPPTVTATNPLTFSNVTLPAGANGMILYEVNVTQFAPPNAGSIIVNTAEISGGGLSEPLTASASVQAREEAELTISKSLCPSTVQDNGEITYTFIIQNAGSQPAAVSDSVVVSDVFNPILNPILVEFNDTLWSAPTNYTYDTATGLFQTVAGQITVPAATYTQDPETGVWITTPGVSVLRVTGTV